MIAPEQPSPQAAAATKSEFFIRKYLAQVTYPRVVCYPRNDLSEQTIKQVFQRRQEPLTENEADLEAIARHEQFYKLTRLKGVKLSFPHFCTVHYGPWLAIVLEQESCFAGVRNQWTLFIVEMPEVELIWYGVWWDIPAHLYPSLHVIMGNLAQVAEARHCCPGFKWCATTNSCIPLSVECDSPFPV